MKRMREEDVPAFVREVAATGCDICAVGPGYYYLGDSDVPRGKRTGLYKKLDEIQARCGNRDYLRYDIAAYLASIGRYIDPPPTQTDASPSGPGSTSNRDRQGVRWTLDNSKHRTGCYPTFAQAFAQAFAFIAQSLDAQTKCG
ncbi:hypothetical protein [Mesorhizobium shangrilense]|uniref:Uncharacterized protein n=1 Tax=Mesorhizobium shangrilense TaxID=460060 RepID=A0ABV2DRX2_9HYPH